MRWLAAYARRGQEVFQHINPTTAPWNDAEKRVRGCSAGWGIPFATFDPILIDAKRTMRELAQVAMGNEAVPFSLLDRRYASLDERLQELANSVPAPPPTPTDKSKGCPPPGARSKRIPRAEAEILVRDWLAMNAKDNPAGITRDRLAAETGVSTGQVSLTAAWIAFRERRDSETKPTAREVPLTDAMQAVVPSDCKTPDELAALIDEQKKDEAEQERRHKRRHRPS
jgi:hypothetical protein